MDPEDDEFDQEEVEADNIPTPLRSFQGAGWFWLCRVRHGKRGRRNVTHLYTSSKLNGSKTCCGATFNGYRHQGPLSEVNCQDCKSVLAAKLLVAIKMPEDE